MAKVATILKQKISWSFEKAKNIETNELQKTRVLNYVPHVPLCSTCLTNQHVLLA